MSSIQSDDSDHEGFIPNILKIDEQQIEQELVESPKFKLNEPQYILGQTLISKQPPETYIAIRDIPKKPISFKSIPTPTSQFKSHLPTARNKFCSEIDYILVYSRQQLPFGDEDNKPFQHEIKLKSSSSGQKLKFRNIRKWKREDIQNETPADQDLLQFDSKFEGGNLQCAFKSINQPNTYTLFIHNDTNTNGYNQWFYFSIANAKTMTPYTFKIANFKKPYSFFTKGLQPLVFSLAQANINGNGWYRDGSNLSYYISPFRQIDCSPYYTLEFEITFMHQNDYITISPYIPYSYSRLISNIKLNQNKAKERNLIWNIASISKTLGNNQVPYITLSKNEQNVKQKPNIVFLARQHSGQTWSSFLIQELLDELLEEGNCISQWILQSYNIRIFPMINIDGVIYGNFRCDLGGYDLNRCWKDPSPSLHPQIYAIKQQIIKLSEDSSIQFCFDFHTHSKDLGVFGYCCVQSQTCRAFPMLLGKITPLFRYPASTFGISRGKQQTLRAEVFKITSSNKVITIQMSAFGFKTNNSNIPRSFSITHINMLAKALNQGIYSNKTGQSYQTIQLGNLVDENEQTLQNYFKTDLKQDQQIDGSDSEPEIDQIELQIKLEQIFPEQFLEDKSVKDKLKTKTKVFKKVKKVPKQLGRLYSNQKSLINFKPNQENRQRSKTQIQPESIVINRTQTKKYLPQTLRQTARKKIMFETPKNLNNKKSQKKPQPEISRTAQPLNFIEFSLKKLPIFSSLQSVGLSRKYANRYDKIACKDETNQSEIKNINKGLKSVKNKNDQQELPYLCIMSQTKRQLQMARIRERKHNRHELNRTEINRMEIKYLNNSLDHQKNQKNVSLIGKFSQSKNKNTIQTSTKMWMFNYSRYGQSIDKRYF